MPLAGHCYWYRSLARSRKRLPHPSVEVRGVRPALEGHRPAVRWRTEVQPILAAVVAVEALEALAVVAPESAAGKDTGRHTGADIELGMAQELVEAVLPVRAGQMDTAELVGAVERRMDSLHSDQQLAASRCTAPNPRCSTTDQSTAEHWQVLEPTLLLSEPGTIEALGVLGSCFHFTKLICTSPS